MTAAVEGPVTGGVGVGSGADAVSVGVGAGVDWATVGVGDGVVTVSSAGTEATGNGVGSGWGVLQASKKVANIIKQDTTCIYRFITIPHNQSDYNYSPI